MEILPFRPFQIAAVVEYTRHPSSKRNDAGGNPAGSASLRRRLRLGEPLPGSVKVARRPVKPLVLVRVQVWQPFSGCNVSSRRPCSERGGRRCNSCHPDHRMVGRAVMPRSRKPSEPSGCVGAIPTPSATFQTLNQRHSYEIHDPLPKPVAVSPEL